MGKLKPSPETRRLLREAVNGILGIAGPLLRKSLDFFAITHALNQRRVGFLEGGTAHLRHIMESSRLDSRRWSAFRALRILMQEQRVEESREIITAMESFLDRHFPAKTRANMVLGCEFAREESLPRIASLYSQGVVGIRENSSDIHLAKANAWSVLENSDETASKRLREINECLSFGRLSPVTLKKPGLLTLGNLKALDSVLSLDENSYPPLVSVILAVRNGAQWISFALESLLTQTWHNIEVIVVDDGSEDQTSEILRDYTRRDSRVRVIHHQTSRGLFPARNAGLREAKGEFVTTHDADDWSHPEKIARQAKHLINKPSVVANYSQWVRCSPDLHFIMREAAGRFIHVNPNSLMVRRDVFSRLGGWDPVRFSADSEFVARIRRVYGRAAVGVVEEGPLSFGLERADSLTRSQESHGKSAYAGVRREYREHFQAWHARTKKSSGDWRVHEGSETRRFPAPSKMQSQLSDSPTRHADVVVCGDFSKTRNKKKLDAVLSGCSEKSLRVVLVHLPAVHAPLKPVLRALRLQRETGDSRFAVFGDVVEAKLVIFLNWAAPYSGNRLLPEIKRSGKTMVSSKRHLKDVERYPFPKQWEFLTVMWASLPQINREIRNLP